MNLKHFSFLFQLTKLVTTLSLLDDSHIAHIANNYLLKCLDTDGIEVIPKVNNEIGLFIRLVKISIAFFK